MTQLVAALMVLMMSCHDSPADESMKSPMYTLIEERQTRCPRGQGQQPSGELSLIIELSLGVTQRA